MKKITRALVLSCALWVVSEPSGASLTDLAKHITISDISTGRYAGLNIDIQYGKYMLGFYAHVGEYPGEKTVLHFTGLGSISPLTKESVSNGDIYYCFDLETQDPQGKVYHTKFPVSISSIKPAIGPDCLNRTELERLLKDYAINGRTTLMIGNKEWTLATECTGVFPVGPIPSFKPIKKARLDKKRGTYSEYCPGGIYSNHYKISFQDGTNSEIRLDLRRASFKDLEELMKQ